MNKMILSTIIMFAAVAVIAAGLQAAGLYQRQLPIGWRAPAGDPVAQNRPEQKTCDPGQTNLSAGSSTTTMTWTLASWPEGLAAGSVYRFEAGDTFSEWALAADETVSGEVDYFLAGVVTNDQKKLVELEDQAAPYQVRQLLPASPAPVEPLLN